MINMMEEIRILEIMTIELILRLINLEVKELKDQQMNLIIIEIIREEIIKPNLNKMLMFLLKIEFRKTEIRDTLKRASMNQIITINPEIIITISKSPAVIPKIGMITKEENIPTKTTIVVLLNPMYKEVVPERMENENFFKI